MQFRCMRGLRRCGSGWTWRLACNSFIQSLCTVAFLTIMEAGEISTDVAMQPQGRNGFIFVFLELVPLQRLRLHRPGPLVLLLGRSSCGQPPNDEKTFRSRCCMGGSLQDQPSSSSARCFSNAILRSHGKARMFARPSAIFGGLPARCMYGVVVPYYLPPA